MFYFTTFLVGFLAVLFCLKYPRKKLIPIPHKQIQIIQNGQNLYLNSFRLLQSTTQEDSTAKNIGLLIFAVIGLHVTIARLSYEWSRFQLRERGQAIQQVLDLANRMLFHQKTKDGKPALVWEVSSHGLWLECNIRDIERKLPSVDTSKNGQGSFSDRAGEQQ